MINILNMDKYGIFSITYWGVLFPVLENLSPVHLDIFALFIFTPYLSQIFSLYQKLSPNYFLSKTYNFNKI